MKWNPYLLIFFCFQIPSALFSQAIPPPGAVYSDMLLEKLPFQRIVLSKDSGVPPHFSLSDYCDNTFDQESFPLCTPIAVAKMLGTYHAYKHSVFASNKAVMNTLTPSILHLYNNVVEGKPPKPVALDTAVSFLMRKGAYQEKDFPSRPLRFDKKSLSSWSDIWAKRLNVYSARSIISDKKVMSDQEKLDAVKTMLSAGIPVVVQFNVDQRFFNISTNGIWKPFQQSTDNQELFHAAIVVGYDDDSFELANSFGTDWGNEGFFEMSYEDFLFKILHAAVIYPTKKDFDQLGGKGGSIGMKHHLIAHVELLKKEGDQYKSVRLSVDEQLLQEKNIVQYINLDTLRYEDNFRFSLVETSESQIIYLIYKDREKTYQYDLLSDLTEGQLFPKKNSWFFEKGKDPVIFLISKKPIPDFSTYLSDLQKLEGEEYEKIHQVFKDFLIPEENLIRHPEHLIGLPSEESSATNQLFPIVLTIKVH